MAQDGALSPGDIIRERFLEPNGITVYKLAKAIGKRQSNITGLLNGSIGMSPEMAYLIGKALDVNPEYLMALSAKYQLSKIDKDEMPEVTQLVTRDDKESGMYESCGYVYSDLKPNDAMAGRAVRGAMMAAAELDHGRGELLDSINNYFMHGIITVPGSESYYEYKEDVPDAAMGIYKQFLVCAGEDPEQVNSVTHEARHRVYQEAGETDIDGVEYPVWRRSVRKVDIKLVGELMCAASQMSQESREEVMECLFAYAHDETMTLPDDDDAYAAFKRFLEKCEGYHRMTKATGTTADEYFNGGKKLSIVSE